MLTGKLLDVLRAEGARFAEVAAKAGPDAPIPTCPGWVMRDLVHHVGEVHRWATAIVGGGITRFRDIPADTLGPLPDDAGMVSWWRAGHRQLVDALRMAPESLQAVVFLAAAESPRHMWVRRQAHELEIHRLDAESAIGSVTPFAAESAADGVDEFLRGFLPRPVTKWCSTNRAALLVELADDPRRWLVQLSDEQPVVELVAADLQQVGATCTVRARADDMYAALWNRAALADHVIDGDPDIARSLSGDVQVRWS